MGNNNISNSEKTIFDSLKDLTKIFLNRFIDSGVVLYRVYNPSISDFIINEKEYQIKQYIKLLTSLTSIESISLLEKLIKQGFFKESQIKEILDGLVRSALNNTQHNINYLLQLLTIDNRFNSKYKTEVISIIQELFRKPVIIDDISKLLSIMDIFFTDIHISNWDKLVLLFNDRYLSESELSDLCLFVSKHNIETDEINTVLTDNLINFLSDLVDDVQNLGLKIDDYFEYEYYSEYHGSEIVKDESLLLDHLHDALYEVLSDLNASEYDFVINTVISDIDATKIIDDYLNTMSAEDYFADEYKEMSSSSYTNERENVYDKVDDLFIRN